MSKKVKGNLKILAIVCVSALFNIAGVYVIDKSYSWDSGYYYFIGVSIYFLGIGIIVIAYFLGWASDTSEPETDA